MRRARRASSFISLHKKVFESCDLNQSVNNKINGRSSNCDKGRNSQSFTVNHWLWEVWQRAGWMALNILHKDRAHQLEPCPFSLLSPPTTNPRRRSIKRARVISTVLLIWLNAFCSRQSRWNIWLSPLVWNSVYISSSGVYDIQDWGDDHLIRKASGPRYHHNHHPHCSF